MPPMPSSGFSAFTSFRFVLLKNMNALMPRFGAFLSFFFFCFLPGDLSSFFRFASGVPLIFFSAGRFFVFSAFLLSCSSSLSSEPLAFFCEAFDSPSEDSSVGSPPSLDASATKSSSSSDSYSAPPPSAAARALRRIPGSSSSSSESSSPAPAALFSARLTTRRPLACTKLKRLSYSEREMLRNWYSASLFISTLRSNVLAELRETPPPWRWNSTSATSSYARTVVGLVM
mmetsp:Transcript_25214/g.47646  ORF Transcript_25214/g.47646 Transcript_25214/m.47646 type:complete len:230 (-) Transcript_25214:1227-1916(-)